MQTIKQSASYVEDIDTQHTYSHIYAFPLAALYVLELGLISSVNVAQTIHGTLERSDVEKNVQS